MEFVQYEQQGMVGMITIDRPNALNALNSRVLAEMGSAFDEIDLNAVRCVILTGRGDKAFVAGADIGEMRSLSKAEGEAFGRRGSELFRRIETFAVPVIAAVNGFALGGGCELAMACDIRLASENAAFAQPEVGLGITPGFGGTQRLGRLIGLGKAKELLYTGNKIKAAEALALGLVNAVYPGDALMGEAVKMAEKIASNAPIAVRAAKKAVNDGIEADMDTALNIEAKLFGQCFESEDQQNAMTAFVEKRRPAPFVNQ
ncbi:MAG: enoyl-CoA hydratase/isomerase family protein [Planctomycetota bacterium]|jgi:enoyl-CoA hydratase|nr:enoyl-CoA hydratase/isomerase family protein [Planctomycetota bacterium]